VTENIAANKDIGSRERERTKGFDVLVYYMDERFWVQPRPTSHPPTSDGLEGRASLIILILKWQVRIPPILRGVFSLAILDHSEY
jgi:hypothetical protein